MDLRVESLVTSIHDHRNDCKVKLDGFKQELER